MDPADAKCARRMLSYRESDKRSRRKKQAHLTKLETKVSQLRVENSSLLKCLTDISLKYNEAAVDNRVLKADVETMRAKVKMAEEAVKRITGLNPLFHGSPEMSSMSMSSFGGTHSDTLADAAVQDDPKHHLFQPPSDNPVSTLDPRINNDLTDISSVENVQPNAGASVAENKMGRTVSVEGIRWEELFPCRKWLAWSICKSEFVEVLVPINRILVESNKHKLLDHCVEKTLLKDA